jgi:hypothetical protein
VITRAPCMQCSLNTKTQECHIVTEKHIERKEHPTHIEKGSGDTNLQQP